MCIYQAMASPFQAHVSTWDDIAQTEKKNEEEPFKHSMVQFLLVPCKLIGKWPRFQRGKSWEAGGLSNPQEARLRCIALTVCNKFAFCILNKRLKWVFTHLKTTTGCSISFYALQPIVNALLPFGLWQIIVKQLPVPLREILGPWLFRRVSGSSTSLIRSWSSGIMTHASCKAHSPTLIPSSKEALAFFSFPCCDFYKKSRMTC